MTIITDKVAKMIDKGQAPRTGSGGNDGVPGHSGGLMNIGLEG